jgi:hypothetical protein
VRQEELKEELAEAKRNCGKYLNQIIDEQKEEKEKMRKLFTEEEVECIKQLGKVDKENAVRDAEYVFSKEKGNEERRNNGRFIREKSG